MARYSKTPVFLSIAILFALVISVMVFSQARADIAPPESPPGAGISPENEGTQVRMVSEVVTLTVISGSLPGKAKTEGIFIMRNLGSAEERINVRFPLTFGEALYYSDKFPEIKDFQVQVDGKTVSTSRTVTKDSTGNYNIPWANFQVKFPVNQDVIIKVTYTAQGFGYHPFTTFRYILETGAGWKGDIGSGDIIFRLPYEASPENIVLDPENGFSKVASSPVFSGKEVRWHFDNLEPTRSENFQVDMVSLDVWQKVLTERGNTVSKPKDGEAWGRLGKAIKESLRFNKGYLRGDDGGNQLYREGVSAYEKAVTLKPKDALWHYGFADLLWSRYITGGFSGDGQDYSLLTRLAVELKATLELNPSNSDAQDLAEWISDWRPWVLSKADSGYDFIILTATPTATPVILISEATTTTEQRTAPVVATPSVTAEKTVTLATPTSTNNNKAPAGKVPFCGGTALLLPFLAGLFLVFMKRH